MYKYIDYLSLPLSLWLATVIRFHYPLFTPRETYLLFASILSWYVASSLFHLYDKPDRHPLKRRITIITSFFFIMTGLSFYAHNELQFSRIVLALFTSFQCTIPLIIHVVVFRIFNPENHPANYGSIIIGEGPIFEETIEQFRMKEKQYTTFRVQPSYTLRLEEIFSKVKESENIQEIILIFPFPEKAFTDSIITEAEKQGIRVQLFTDNQTLSSFPLKAETIGVVTHYRPLLNSLEHRDNRILKRIFDCVVSLLMMIVLSPLLLFIAVLLKVTSLSEPVFFTQKRTGYNQKEFECFKFRSMTTVPQEFADKTQATKSDPRITKLGAFLRKTNLDELPQLFNVLKGDMSLVGPRPHPVIMNNHKEDVPSYLLRHFVVPGMTGWAQVNGFRGPTDTEEKIRGRVEHDLWYIEHWSLWFDIKIMFLTLFSRKVYENAF